MHPNIFPFKELVEHLQMLAFFLWCIFVLLCCDLTCKFIKHTELLVSFFGAIARTQNLVPFI